MHNFFKKSTCASRLMVQLELVSTTKLAEKPKIFVLKQDTYFFHEEGSQAGMAAPLWHQRPRLLFFFCLYP